MAKKILIIDDDKDLVESLERVLRGNGYDVASAPAGPTGCGRSSPSGRTSSSSTS